MGRVEAADIAATYSGEIKAYTESKTGSELPKLVAFLANDDKAAVMYARWTEKACTRDGIIYELRKVERVDLEASVIEANNDPTVHGILVYYPVFGGPIDDYLRDVISVTKDVEGLNHRYRYALYHNVRTLDEHRGAKCVLPCTPLACVKIIETLGAYDTSRPVGQRLGGRTAVVVNRSEVVGRPLAAMLANDGAQVFSIDVTGMLLYTAGSVAGTIRVEETQVTQDEAYKRADIVISGVPAKGFSIPAAKLKPGVIAVNISQFQNFGDGVAELGTYVPAVGKVTIAMLERNLLRLHANFHDAKAASLAKLWGRWGVAAATLALGIVVAVGRRRGAIM